MMFKTLALALLVALLLFSLKVRAQLRDSTALQPDSLALQQHGDTTPQPDSLALQQHGDTALRPDSLSLQQHGDTTQLPDSITVQRKDSVLHGSTRLRRDSVDWSAGGAFRRRIDRRTSTKAYRMLFIGTPLIVGGVIMQSYDRDFRRLRNGYVPSFHQKYDDWLQYAPAGAMLAMKTCGVKSRSSWGRMLVSDAFSAGLMAIAVNSLKYTCRVMRPDGSTRNSFPSGHTATAFMTATMLHKEYGHRSPWYSIGGYAVATATGVTRQLNNRHWMSDVMVGAGIGILATEFGYFLADLIFKERGLNVYETFSVHDRYRHPSFVGFAIGVMTIPGSYTTREGMRMRFHSGPTTGVQGAWFASPYWGIGGRLACSNLRTGGQQRHSGRQLRKCLGLRRPLLLLSRFAALAGGFETPRRLRILQTVQHLVRRHSGTQRRRFRHGNLNHLSGHAEPRRTLCRGLRSGTITRPRFGRAAAQTLLRNRGLRRLLTLPGEGGTV